MYISEDKWEDIYTDPFWFDEVRLFLSRCTFEEPTSCWRKRCDEWYVHVTLFACIHSKISPPELNKIGTDQTPPHIPWTTERIEFLFRHLNILDQKFGILLTFNSLLLVAINLLVDILLNLMKDHKGSISCVVSLSIAFGLFWFLTTILCLYGERRLVWGDLGLISNQGARLRSKLLSMVTAEDVRNAEDRHVKALIIAVAKRTNKFRVAIRLTTLNVLLLAATFIAALWLLKDAYQVTAFL